MVLRCTVLLTLLSVFVPLHTNAQVDCLGVLGGPAQPGTPCNDSTATAGNDTWNPSCICEGQLIDCNGIPGGTTLPGTACDDGNANTVNDVRSVDCICIGDDFVDCEGVMGGSAWPGTVCDDGDPLTTTELWSSSCVCMVPWTDCASVQFGYHIPGFPCDDANPWTEDEVWSAACVCIGDSINLVSGVIFFDVDQNGTYGAGDFPVPNRTLHTSPGNTSTVSIANGTYTLVLQAGTHELIVSPGAADHQSGMPYTVTFANGGNSSSGHDLALTATAPLTDLGVHGAFGPARPGFNTGFHIYVTNMGNRRIDGSVVFAFDPLQQFVSSNPAATVNGNTLSWDLDTLELGEFVHMAATVYTPTSAAIGTPIQYTAQLTTPDDNPANDLWSASPLVVASNDPNDIQVTPVVLSPQEVADGTPVTYTIRFQNTGTFLAEHVRLIDSLPAELNTATFTFLGSTHACTAQLAAGVLDLRFDHIMLPDSGTDLLLSNGAAMFQFTPQLTLPLGTVVANRADILFDFNPPVRTNDAVFTVEQSTGIGISAPTWEPQLRPNPASDMLHVQLPALQGAPVGVRVIDQSGRVLRDLVHPSGTTLSMALDGLADGIYNVQVTGDGLSVNKRFVKQR
ncbi:MAG: T9SS type A sorting domain-containing protein [Flavobacteriales bacterium]|nr:T9SS type A sorting domain-containing protein [Flavobacteriales bacterium]MBP6699113.1 T9SS type A sorting domain-containing protein [Flavobacteriales bacterium]